MAYFLFLYAPTRHNQTICPYQQIENFTRHYRHNKIQKFKIKYRKLVKYLFLNHQKDKLSIFFPKKLLKILKIHYTTQHKIFIYFFYHSVYPDIKLFFEEKIQNIVIQ